MRFLAILLAFTPLSALPEGVPDYSGFTAANFFERVASVPADDYSMPKIEPGKSLIVAANGDDANAGTVEKPFRTLAVPARN